ncbi:D-cysteine desulfhydrase 1 [Scenedesmus sp. PABB004]|nr:D-cysteine desulfhydrase 1 [Scenedesmus sp. PABB004]
MAAAPLDDAQFRAWKTQLVPLLYDWFSNHNLTWPSQACRAGAPAARGGEAPRAREQPRRAPRKARAAAAAAPRAAQTNPDEQAKDPCKLLVVDVDLVKPRVASTEVVSTWTELSRCPYMKEVKALVHPGEVNKIRELPQVPEVVVTHTDARELYVWNTATQPGATRDKVTGKWGSSVADAVLTGHERDALFPLSACSVAPLVASGGTDKLVLLWSLEDQQSGLLSTKRGDKGDGERRSTEIKHRHKLRGHRKTVEDLVFQPGSTQRLVSVGDDAQVLFWDVDAGAAPVAAIRDAHGAGSDVHTVDWSRVQDHLVVTGAADGSLKVWDRRKLPASGAEPGGAVHVFTYHSDAIMRAEWHPTEPGVFASGGEDHLVVKVVDFQWCPGSPWTMMSISDDTAVDGDAGGGKSGGGTLQLWRLSDLVTLPEAEALAELEAHREWILTGKDAPRRTTKPERSGSAAAAAEGGAAEGGAAEGGAAEGGAAAAAPAAGEPAGPAPAPAEGAADAGAAAGDGGGSGGAEGGAAPMQDSAPLAAMSSAASFLELQPYVPPPWAAHLKLVPRERFRLGLLPTPLHRWPLPGVPAGVELWIKRDDMSGMQLSGNKVRKLEFLLADAKAKGADCVSNHARATAVAAAYLGLPAHLILRTSRAAVDGDPGLTGNLLVERLAGATIHLVTKEEYARHGAAALGGALCDALRAGGAAPYYIPVGGSSALGCWGYVQAAAELAEQAAALGVSFDAIALACGSSGTVAGLALGAAAAGGLGRVHAFGVCDDPEYFYDEVDALLSELGHTGPGARALFTAHQARGDGYALSREEELRTVLAAGLASGIVLDPVYSGKALHGLLGAMAAAPEEWAGKRVLFVHTGGLLGTYDKADQLQPLVEELGRVSRLDLAAPARAARQHGAASRSSARRGEQRAMGSFVAAKRELDAAQAEGAGPEALAAAWVALADAAAAAGNGEAAVCLLARGRAQLAAGAGPDCVQAARALARVSAAQLRALGALAAPGPRGAGAARWARCAARLPLGGGGGGGGGTGGAAGRRRCRVFAVSDLHVDAGGMRWVRCVHATAFRDDVLVVAGDAGDTAAAVRAALAALAPRFRRVVYVPGNHDLWARPGTSDEATFDDAWAKLMALRQARAAAQPPPPTAAAAADRRGARAELSARTRARRARWPTSWAWTPGRLRHDSFCRWGPVAEGDVMLALNAPTLALAHAHLAAAATPALTPPQTPPAPPPAPVATAAAGAGGGATVRWHTHGALAVRGARPVPGLQVSLARLAKRPGQPGAAAPANGAPPAHGGGTAQQQQPQQPPPLPQQPPQQAQPLVITVSHFLPDDRLPHSRVSELAKAMGCLELQAQLEQVGSCVHVFGHSHRNVDVLLPTRPEFAAARPGGGGSSLSSSCDASSSDGSHPGRGSGGGSGGSVSSLAGDAAAGSASGGGGVPRGQRRYVQYALAGAGGGSSASAGLYCIYDGAALAPPGTVVDVSGP